MSKHVAVLMGGWSAEREVSLRSGAACAKALRDEGFRVTEIDVDRNIAQRLAELKPDVAFNALHGKVGEDGTIQGILEVLQIPYTHSGVLASSLAMQKDRAKAVMKAAGVPVMRIGKTGGDTLTLPRETPISIAELVRAHEDWLPNFMSSAK